MSISLQEVIEAAGYTLETLDDAIWLLSKQKEFEHLVDAGQDLIDKEEDRQSAIDEAEYKKRFGDD